MTLALSAAPNGSMIRTMQEQTAEGGRVSRAEYFHLWECGILSPDERVELLEGMIVAMAPATPLHEAAVNRVQYALLRKLGLDVVTRVQSTFLAGDQSVVEPDVVIVPGRVDDYDHRHPTRAQLVVEVSWSSLPQDRLTKSAIYARSDVPCYWIVNLRERCVEVFRKPDRWKWRYEVTERASGGDILTIDAFPRVSFVARDLLPEAVDHFVDND